MGLGRVPDLAFNVARLQITGLDTFFGVAPIKSRSWPSGQENSGEATYSVTLNPESKQSWEAGGVRVVASYDRQSPINDVYQQRVRFAPVLTVEVDVLLSVDDWIECWIAPLIRFVSFATSVPQKLSWVSFTWQGSEPPPQGGRVSAQLFGSGISQLGYEASAPDWLTRRGNRPLLTLAGLHSPLPLLLDRWRALDEDENVFFSLVRMVISQPELPHQARYLFLIQALESLHGVEHIEEDEAEQKAYQASRVSALDAISQTAFDSESMKFIKNNWSKRRPDSLARRLRDQLDWLPQGAAAAVDALAMTPIASNLTEGGALKLDAADLLQRLRNELSHGNSHWDEDMLAPWADALELACRLQVLRLLGFDDRQVELAAEASLSPN